MIHFHQTALEELSDVLVDALTLGLRDKRVQLSTSEQLPLAQAHGVIHAHAQGGVKRIGFLVDKPNYLKRPNNETVMSLFKQALKLGFTPTHIEVLVGKRRSYRAGSLEPIFS